MNRKTLSVREFAGILGLSVAVTFVFLTFAPRDAKAPTSEHEGVLMVGGNGIRLLVADTPEEQVQGLSGHTPLGDDEAMLFVFDREAPRGIWMKDMLFPLDILWIDGAGRVVDIKEGVSPASYPEVFGLDVSATYVLEASVGFARRFGVATGTELSFDLD